MTKIANHNQKKVDLSQNIEFIRVLKGITQEELGNHLGGISKQAVSKMLKRKISEDRLVKIAKILNVTPEVIKNLDIDAILKHKNIYSKSIDEMLTYFEEIIREKQETIKRMQLASRKNDLKLYRTTRAGCPCT